MLRTSGVKGKAGKLLLHLCACVLNCDLVVVGSIENVWSEGEAGRLLSEVIAFDKDVKARRCSRECGNGR